MPWYTIANRHRLGICICAWVSGGCGTAPGRCNGGPRGATVSELISMRLLSGFGGKNYAMTSPVAYNLGSLVAEKDESAL